MCTRHQHYRKLQYQCWKAEINHPDGKTKIDIQSNPDTVRLCDDCSLWQLIEFGGNAEYCIIGNLFLLTHWVLSGGGTMMGVLCYGSTVLP